MPDDASSKITAPAADRALRVLELLADAEEGQTLTTIASSLGLPKSSVHHVLGALIDRGWVERDADLRLSLGLRAWEVGQAYDHAQTLSQRARGFMDEVRDEIDETVRLAVLSGQGQVCIAKSPGSHTLVFDQRIGARLPAHATGLGKALLSGLDEAQLDALYPGGELEQFTETTMADLAALKADLARARELGYAEDHGEYILGIRCVAVPVLSRDEQIVAALSVSGPVHRFDDEHIHAALTALQDAAQKLQKRISDDISQS